ncbi:hypothetical protein EDB86DRAFT_213331 [Lactarius hatsudake]|nr:hypothetical protein EDB86DRAFT_213331 [Lactarius hatsudake]
MYYCPPVSLLRVSRGSLFLHSVSSCPSPLHLLLRSHLHCSQTSLRSCKIPRVPSGFDCPIFVDPSSLRHSSSRFGSLCSCLSRDPPENRTSHQRFITRFHLCLDSRRASANARSQRMHECLNVLGACDTSFRINPSAFSAVSSPRRRYRSPLLLACPSVEYLGQATCRIKPVGSHSMPYGLQARYRCDMRTYTNNNLKLWPESTICYQNNASVVTRGDSLRLG